MSELSALEQNSFYQRLLDSFAQAVISMDSAGKITYGNRAAEALGGWSESEIVGQTIQTLLPLDFEWALDLTAFAASTNGKPRVRDVTLAHKDGSSSLMQATVNTIHAADGVREGISLWFVPAEASGMSAPLSNGHRQPVQSLATALNLMGDQSLDALQTDRGLFRRALDTLPIGVSVVNDVGQVVLRNAADKHIWADTTPADMTDEESRKAWLANSGQLLAANDFALSKALQAGKITLNEILEIESSSGTRKTVLNSAAPITDDGGSVIGGIEINQDITEQRRLEMAERKNRTFANALSNITAVLTSSLDLKTVMERILENVGRVVLHEAANIMLIEGDTVRVAFWHNYGPKCDELFRTARYSVELPMLRQMLDTGLPQLVSDTRTTPDWETFPETDWVRSAVGVPIRSRDVILGFLTLDSAEPNFFQPPDAERLRAFAYQSAIAIENARLFSTVREHASELETRVTQRTAELRRAKDHVEAILEHSSDAIVLVNTQGAIIEVNPSFRYLFGVNAAQDGYPVLESLVEPDQWERLAAVFAQVQANGRADRIEISFERLGGSEFDVDMAIAPLFDPSTGSYLYVCNLHDITQQKMAERELRSALETEKALGELKARFVAMVSHEFRTPLASIQTSTDLLYSYYDRLTPERRNEIISRIQSQIRRLTRLLEDVLTISKADTFGLVLDLSLVDLNTFCADIIKEVRYSIAQDRVIELQQVTGSWLVELDSHLFQQVLINLLSNALKYSSAESKVQMELEAMPDQVAIRVRDHGIGIPPEDVSGLFEAFYRAGNVGGRQGTGLGLAVVKRAVEAHHGTVSVDSELGVGTSITVRMPRRQSPKS